MSFRSDQIVDENVLPFPGGAAAAVVRAFCCQVPAAGLIVLHQETSTPGRVGNALRALGHPLDIRRPRFGDALPETLDEHAGAVIFGGPMSANDRDDYVRREIDWIELPLREQRPFLGICLGAQMLAKQLGARVAPHPEGRAEVGYYPIRPTEAGHALCPDWPEHVYHWHGEGFELPAGAELLAEGGDFPVQAFQHRPCVRLAVSSRRDLRDDASLDHARLRRLDSPGAQARHLHFEGRAVHDVAERAWLKAFHRRLARAHAALGDVGSRGIAADAEFVPRAGIYRPFQIRRMC